MLGNFVFFNPTKIYFGKDAIEHLLPELDDYGQNVTLVYGKESIKKIGLYDEVVAILMKAGKKISEISGVMPNPTIQKVYEGIEVVKENKTDLLLAVGGGSVIDYAKAVAGSADCDGDPWEKFYLRREECTNRVIPIACVLTMAGTGSEMNDNGTITNHETKQKIGYKFGKDAYPKFAIMDPEYTYSVSYYQFAAGTFDIMSHIMEQYFSNMDDNVSDDIAEGLMRSVIRNANVARTDLTNYEARSNLMWASTLALNNLIAMGKTGDWEVHMMGQAIAAFTDATHGMTLSCVSIPYYLLMAKYYPSKFVRFAINVWNVDPSNKTDDQIAKKGLDCLKKWMIELGVAMSIREVGINEDMIEELVDNTPINDTGYHKLSKEELTQIYKDSL